MNSIGKDDSMADEIWVVADFKDPKSLGLLGKAQELAHDCHGQAAAVCALDYLEAEPLIQHGADIVYHMGVKGSESIQAQALGELCLLYHPEIVLFPATIEFSVVAARTAAQLGTGLTADCTGLAIDENGWLRQTRPAYGGGIIADIHCKYKRPQMATVRPGIFLVSAPDPQRKGIHISFSTSNQLSDPAQLISRELIPAKKDLREGRIIVAGGKGIGSREGFGLLGLLAERIGGLVGASRSAVNAGYADYDCQIGQTGMSVSPDLYLAFGISGAAQHIAGMITASKIIAVNNDPRAPIFDYADLAIVGDWKETAEGILKLAWNK
jgi:electron transfer flavoprotein alpha subunit